ncbi:hypothetical protein [Armatimonas sp.]|uniref:hypothetical protein n=1 Tax=Armatimonas sp. TaxID=1872638 RepID=UPI00374CADCF
MRFGNVAAMLIVPALILSVGCKKPTPVGKWSGTINNIPGTLELKEGGQLGVIVSAMGQSITISGTWSTNGDKITTAMTSATPAMAMSFVPANMRSSTGTWKVEGDTLTLISNGGTQTYTRVKE